MICSCSKHTNTLQVTITILFKYCCKPSNSMEDSLSEANSSAITHKIPCMLWIKVYNCAHNSPSLASIQHQANAFHSYFIKIHFNIILPSRPRPSKWSFSFTFPHQTLVCISLPHACHKPHTSHLLCFDNPSHTWRTVHIMMFQFMQSSPLPLPHPSSAR